MELVARWRSQRWEEVSILPLALLSIQIDPAELKKQVFSLC